MIGDPSLAEHECKFSDISMHEVIGMGAFGKVYKAVWMGTDVAVKDFSCQQVTESLLEDFRSEALLMRNLRHPVRTRYMKTAVVGILRRARLEVYGTV